MSENHTHRLTTDDLVAIPEDGNWYELIDGQIVRSEHPLLSHQRILDNLIYRFGVVPKNERNCSFWSNVGVIFDRHNSVIPDFVFVRKDRKAEIASGEYITGTPDLIVEILSLGTENIERDRILKLQAYESFGLPEYWIVDPFNRLVEILKIEESKLLLSETLANEDVLDTELMPGFKCRIEHIFTP